MLTVVFRPNLCPNGTLSTLEAGLGTVVLQASIEHTAGDQLRSVAYMCRFLTRLDLFPGLCDVLVIAGEARRLALLQRRDHTRRTQLCFWEIFQSLAAFQLCDVGKDI